MAYGIVAANDPVNKIDPSGKFADLGSMVATIAIMTTLAIIAFPSKITEHHCLTITIKRRHVHLLSDPISYGHWWVEMGNESYGWWPAKTGVTYSDTLFGVNGILNGQGYYSNGINGTATRDPHHGDGAEELFNPFISGSAPGDYNCEKAKTCIRKFANSYSGGWSYPIGQNCHSFQEGMMSQCYLQK